jgi:hypothetical protein
MAVPPPNLLPVAGFEVLLARSPIDQKEEEELDLSEVDRKLASFCFAFSSFPSRRIVFQIPELSLAGLRLQTRSGQIFVQKLKLPMLIEQPPSGTANFVVRPVAGLTSDEQVD